MQDDMDWIPLGHRMGFLKHPDSEDYKCPVCEYEQYTLYMLPPKVCPRCQTEMKTGFRFDDFFTATSSTWSTDTVHIPIMSGITKEVREMQDEMNDLQYTTEADPDIVKVVRCGSCKHYEVSKNGANGQCDIQLTQVMYPWDYCSYGERKDEIP